MRSARFIGTPFGPVTAWANKVSQKSFGNTVACKWNTGGQPGTNEWMLTLADGQQGTTPPKFIIESGTTRYAATSGGAVPALGTWYHLVGVREGNTLSIYVDGALMGQATLPPGAVVNNVGRDILLGAMAAGNPANMIVDDLALFRRALSAQEVAALHAHGCDAAGQPHVPAYGYRFGFQGQEKDNEIYGPEGTALSFEYRVHDARVGRFLSIDPLTAKYPYWSPYAFSGNRVVDAVELEGLEPSGINPQTGVSTTANDANSNNGQWDSQLAYPKVPNQDGGGSWDKLVQNLYAIDRRLDLSGKEQYEARKSDGRLKGGFRFVDQYAEGTNNADRMGDPSATFDITGIRALTALAGQGRPGPLRMGEPGIMEATDAASGAVQESFKPKPKLQVSSAQETARQAVVVRSYYTHDGASNQYIKNEYDDGHTEVWFHGHPQFGIVSGGGPQLMDSTWGKDATWTEIER